MDVDLVKDPLWPQTSAFAPGMVAWIAAESEMEVGLVLQQGDRRHIIDVYLPYALGGGLGIAWRDTRQDTRGDELCVAMPSIHCAPEPGQRFGQYTLQVGVIDGMPAVWYASDMEVKALFRLEADAWVPIPLPDAVPLSYSSVLPSGDGIVLAHRGAVTRWVREGGAWVSTPIPHEARGPLTLSTSHLIWRANEQLVRPPANLMATSPPMPPERLHRVSLEDGSSTVVWSQAGHVQLIAAHGQDGTLIVGSEQAEYWHADQLRWRLPSAGMGGAIWEGHPWVSLGATRLRLDGPVIEVADPVPGRFSWSARIEAEIVNCGDGMGLAWQDQDTDWYAWMADDTVQLGHACPDHVDPWPRGRADACALGTRLVQDHHTACVVVGYVHKATDRTIVQLGRARDPSR